LLQWAVGLLPELQLTYQLGQLTETTLVKVLNGGHAVGCEFQ